MTGPINGVSSSAIQQLQQLSQSGIEGIAGGKAEAGFQDLLVQSLEQVNTMQLDAEAAVETLLTGGDINPAEVMTAVQKADMSFRMMQQIRNKLMDAYQELQQIRI